MSVPYFNAAGKRLGQRPKATVHKNGLWHRSALMLIVQSGKILTVTRGKHQSYAGRVDIPGGHEDVRDEGHLSTTCVRESHEELSITLRGERVHLEAHDFALVGGEGSLSVDLPQNKERSSLYGTVIDREATISVMDFDDEGLKNISLRSQFVELKQLLSRYRKSPDFAADGLGRVLEKITTDVRFRELVEEYTVKKHWLITFADLAGSGGPDADFYREEHCSGTRKEAELEARSIGWGELRGDFQWNIELQ